MPRNPLAARRPWCAPVRPRFLSRFGSTSRFETLEERLALTTLPAGFSETLITTASNLSSPTAMEISPTGELWVLEQSGHVQFIRPDGTKQSALDLTVNSSGERGLLGIAFDPAYDGAGPHADYVYLYYTKPRTGPMDPPNNQVVRYTVNGAGTTSPSLAGEVLIRELPPEDEDNDLTTDGDTNHNGGAIHFGPDGKLYVAVGDHNYDPPGSQQATHPSQRTDTPFGKLLRLNPDGTNPADNPFYDGAADDWAGAIWAMGLRNPYTFAIDPADGRIFINDVGEGGWEEIDAGVAGANYGWAGSNSPVWEGFELDGTPPPWANYHDPIMAYNHSGDPPTPAGVDITGGAFYPANGPFGAAYGGKYFFADAGANFIRVFDPARPGTLAQPDMSLPFASNLSTFGPVDLKVDAAGNLYYLARGGELYRISYTGDYGPSSIENVLLFYNNSKLDGGDPAANGADDGAIAPGKVTYRAGEGSTSTANVSSYALGINGVIVDLKGNHGSLAADDFIFRTGNSTSPDAWELAPPPATIAVRPGASPAGSSRVELIWAGDAVRNAWLEITVKGNDAAGGFNTNTGLAESDVFYFGSRVGDTQLTDTGQAYFTNVADEIGVRFNYGLGASITNAYDFNRDQVVSVADEITARTNYGYLFKLDLPGDPTPQVADNAASAVASALASCPPASEAGAPPARAVLTAIGRDALPPDAAVRVLSTRVAIEPQAAKLRDLVLAQLDEEATDSAEDEWLELRGA